MNIFFDIINLLKKLMIKLITMKKKLALLITIFFSFFAAATVPVDGQVAKCKLYPALGNLAPTPSKFNTSNNLVLADVSGFYEAEGTKVTVYGRVMDESCVPLSDATIFIWQANKNGYYQYEGALTKAKWRDPNFNGTGIVKTDNMGRFNFTTIIPGRNPKNLTPFISFKVEHKELQTLKSKLYFSSDDYKIRDNHPISSVNSKIVSAVKSEDKNNVYNIDIVLKQDVAFKEY